MKFGHRAFLVPAPAVNSWILIALARRGCLCGFRVSTGRYAWLRRGALLLRLCRGCGVVCMEPLSRSAVVGSIPPVPGDVCLAPSATGSSALSRSAAPLLFEFPASRLAWFCA